jgi:fatty acid CoA ligase FadD9
VSPGPAQLAHVHQLAVEERCRRLYARRVTAIYLKYAGGDDLAGERQTRVAARIAKLHDEDDEYHARQSVDSVSAALQQPGLSLSQIVATVMQGYHDRPALGHRTYELCRDSSRGHATVQLLAKFETLSYAQVWERIIAVANVWHHDATSPVGPADLVCLIGFASTDYTITDFAALYVGATTVPLTATTPMSQLTTIIAETTPRVLATAIGFLHRAVDIVLAGVAPPRLLVLDYEPLDDEQRMLFQTAASRLADAASSTVLESMQSVIEQGRNLSRAPMYVPESDDALRTLLYTSGSTGMPKGAMCSERTLKAPWVNPSPVPMISLHYLPMSHQYGRRALEITLASGGTGYFAARSDMSTLFEDLRLVRPTTMTFVPRVCELVYESYVAELERHQHSGVDVDDASRDAYKALQTNLFGGRVISASCASAPLTSEMQNFIESCLDLTLTMVYGSTETGGVVINELVQSPPVVDYKLVDVPELGYFRTDRPYPRGELLVKTAALMGGYYKQPEVTAQAFDADGFYKTGDIMAEIGNNRLAYVDRRNNVVKLSQGEFVAVSRLELLFSAHPLISQIFIDANSQYAYLLAVIVPDYDAIGDVAEHAGVRAVLNTALHQVAADAGLESYEIPRDFLIEETPFSAENGLLTAIGKFARPALTERYGAKLQQMHAQITDARGKELQALLSENGDQPVIDKLRRAVRAVLGISAEGLDTAARFIDLGGDSMSALSLSRLVGNMFGIMLPVAAIVDPTSSLDDLATHIERECLSGGSGLTVESIHGPGALARAEDLALSKFIDEATLAEAAALPAPTGEPRTVLLTGANGFLGRFLCLEWAQRLSESGGRLICLVRGVGADDARRRVEEQFSGDDELLCKFREYARHNVEFLAGDVNKPDLRLPLSSWKYLCETVDLIVHPAALVNHRLPYAELFGPNVVGTAELIRLALTTKLKPFHFVSTIAVAMGDGEPPIAEDVDIRIASAQRTTDGEHVHGYATSKWAAEVLLREANDWCQLPVVVFRPGLIMAHTEGAQQLNVSDVFTRLLLSIAATGIAPRSFYEGIGDTTRPRAHYDGLPVDFVAAAIVELGARAGGGVRTYNVVNPHDDGVSLDDFVDWLVDAGYPVERIADYGDWLLRLEVAMRGLPQRQRKYSLLALMDAYRQPETAHAGTPFPCSEFRRAVQTVGVRSHTDIPHLSAKLITKYVDDLRGLGLLLEDVGQPSAELRGS